MNEKQLLKKIDNFFNDLFGVMEELIVYFIEDEKMLTYCLGKDNYRSMISDEKFAFINKVFFQNKIDGAWRGDMYDEYIKNINQTNVRDYIKRINEQYREEIHEAIKEFVENHCVEAGIEFMTKAFVKKIMKDLQEK